jgi:uncharacterized membrane protein
MRLIRLLKNDLAKEAGDWVEKDIITQAQAEQICQQYHVDYHQAKNHSLGYSVLMGLGYLFIGLSLVTLLGANWEEIPRALRMWSLVALTLATQAVALRLYLRGSHAASGLFLLGNLFYGASIILIAQIYHLGEHMPDGVFWWALGCLPAALLLRSTLLMLQTLVLALIWFFLEAGMGFYPLLFPLFVLSAALVLWRGKQSLSLFFMVLLSLLFWFEVTLAELWREGLRYEFVAEQVMVSVVLFLWAYAVSGWLSTKTSVKALDYAAVTALWSLRFGVLFLIIMSFADPWERLLSASWQHLPSLLLIAGVLSIATVLLAWRCGPRGSVLIFLAAFWLALVSVLLLRSDEHALVFQVGTNLLLVGTGVWLIVRGINNRISHYFFLGVATILVTALLRYVDLIGDYVGGALLFLVFAALLLGAARYWKKSHQEVSR